MSSSNDGLLGAVFAGALVVLLSMALAGRLDALWARVTSLRAVDDAGVSSGLRACQGG